MGEYKQFRQEQRERLLSLLYLVLIITGAFVLSILIG